MAFRNLAVHPRHYPGGRFLLAPKTSYNHAEGNHYYGDEGGVGAGLAEAFQDEARREDIFITTKLWSTYHSRVELGLGKSMGVSG